MTPAARSLVIPVVTWSSASRVRSISGRLIPRGRTSPNLKATSVEAPRGEQADDGRVKRVGIERFGVLEAGVRRGLLRLATLLLGRRAEQVPVDGVDGRGLGFAQEPQRPAARPHAFERGLVALDLPHQAAEARVGSGRRESDAKRP